VEGFIYKKTVVLLKRQHYKLTKRCLNSRMVSIARPNDIKMSFL